MPESTTLTNRPAWKALQAHYNEIHSRHLRAMFAEDPKRGERLVVEAAGLYFDYSKHRVTDETLRLLLALADEVGLRGRIDAMFRGDKINVTEKRAVLHIALRAPRGVSIGVDGDDVVPKVHEVLDRMADFSARIRDGSWKGHTGKRIRNIINIGIGGSDLGPVMAYEALRHYSVEFQAGFARGYSDALLDFMPETQNIPVQSVADANGRIREAVQLLEFEPVARKTPEHGPATFGA